MPKLWEIVKPDQLVFLANYQWKTYGTKLDVVIHAREEKNVNIKVSYPSLAEITVTMREKPRQLRGKGW
ncbi:hypothetical protein LCGC14_0416930 [marine sediment metagenome]|uniref:Uncharacterized protein n=1 Tax=marine sediment metagenome TaxID=412755 RepID=A0A0F9SY48_9ZZZZ